MKWLVTIHRWVNGKKKITDRQIFTSEQEADNWIDYMLSISEEYFATVKILKR